MFENRTLFIATKHEKEKVIKPIFEKGLKVRCLSSTELDTDQLGTFSGEVDRLLSPLETLNAKVELGHVHSGIDLVVATEGSFGPNPYLPFCAAHDELILLKDFKHQVCYTARILSTETNFNSKQILDRTELTEFCQQVGFPEHGLILRNDTHSFKYFMKGIQHWETLFEAYEKCVEKYGTVFVETDMRAMFNPLRMEQIKQVTQKLVDKIHVKCPACSMPGFDVVSIVPGLPCQICATPTESILKKIKGCSFCDHQEILEFPNGRKYEDPTFCPLCNP